MGGCDWVAIRNLGITLGVFVGLGTSSVIFAMTWWRLAPEFLWKDWVTGASFGSAAAWLGTGLIFAFVLAGVLSSFCNCTSNIAACVRDCSDLRAALNVLLGVLLALIAVCTVLAAAPRLLETSGVLAVGLTLALVGTAAAIGAVAYLVGRIAGCQ